MTDDGTPAVDTTSAAPSPGRAARRPPDPMLVVRRGVAIGVTAVGWLFILWQNKFHVSAPTVFVCLGYLAIVSSVYSLWRTGVTAVIEEDDDLGDAHDSTWGRPLGARGELEREKRALLKAIKEAEFDREMGKLSASDADEMIKVYRARAIDSIKELDQLDAGVAGSVREQIEREVKARLALASKAADGGAKASTKKARPAPSPEAVAEPAPSAEAPTDAAKEASP